MVEILNAGALNLGLAIGYRTGLFDVMATMDSPQPVSVIAESSGLSVRYIREWMGVMSTAGIVELTDDDGESRFFLPKEHAACLTRNSGPNNLGVYTQEIPLLTVLALESVLHGFKTGKGVPYTQYPQFQAFMTELSNAKHRRVLVQKFLPGVENGRLINRLKTGIRVCDVGCGEGVALLLMARAFPQSVFVGLDLSVEAIQTARSQAEADGLVNVEFQVVDAATLAADAELAGKFDYVTAFDAIHDQTAPLDALKGIKHLLAPGGLFSMVDIAAGSRMSDNLDHPMGPFLYTVSLMHCMPVGLVDGGSGLGMMWGREKAVEMLKAAGFNSVDILDIEDDPFNLHFLCKNP